MINEQGMNTDARLELRERTGGERVMRNAGKRNNTSKHLPGKGKKGIKEQPRVDMP